ncbi:MAG: hypothetical protein HQM11_16560 [SAR324 cluster bacterium]|nr:hypothetical protein [SAR324 cluster bacterium]
MKTSGNCFKNIVSRELLQREIVRYLENGGSIQIHQPQGRPPMWDLEDDLFEFLDLIVVLKPRFIKQTL